MSDIYNDLQVIDNELHKTGGGQNGILISSY